MLRFNDKQKVIINLIQIIIKSHKKKTLPQVDFIQLSTCHTNLIIKKKL